MRGLLRIALAAALLAPAAPLLAGIVSGSVLTASGGGLGGMTVQVWGADNGVLATQTVSSASGFWSVSLPAGTYRFLAFDNNGVYATDFYSGQGSFESSTKVAVTDCGALPGVDFHLATAGALTGTVRDTFGIALGGIVAAAYNADGTQRASTTTGGDGQYRLTVPPGTYRVVVYDNARNHTTQFWRATTDFDLATGVTVGSGGTASGIDFGVATAAVLAGTVRDARTGAPLAGMFVEIYSDAGARLANATTAADGRYVVAVPPGNVKVVATDPKQGYRPVFFSGASSLATATTLTPRAAETLGGVDFALLPASTSSSTELWVVAAASSPGANGTFFRTSLFVLNVGTATAHVALTWLPGGGGDNSGATPVTRDVAPGAELTVDDAVATLFGAAGGGAIRVSSDVPVLVSSRTATPGAAGGTYGLGIPGAGAWRAVVSGRITAVRVDSVFRTNVGFLNPGPQPVTIALTLVDASGGLIAQGSVPLGPLGQFQASTIAAYLGVGTIQQGTLRVTAPAPFFAYSTVIDNVTGDSTFIAAEPD